MGTEETHRGTSRFFPLDVLRGLIMILMALDHASFFVAQQHSTAEIWDGAFPVYQDALTFLTRWVTHLAAPGFFLLMGAGMVLFARSRQKQGWSRWAIMRHFLIRGVILMVLQQAIVNRFWELSPTGWGLAIYSGVLYALGATMVLCSMLVWLRPAYLGALSAILFIGMELTHPGLGMWGRVSHAPLNVAFLHPGGTNEFWAYYSILPWLELVVFGMLLGKWLAGDSRCAFARMWKLGVAFLLAFAVIRYFDGFGNIRPRMSDGWMDFFNPVKYPPSMTYTLMTTGINLTLLWLFSRATAGVERAFQPLIVFGRTLLFFYVLHLPLYAGMGYLLTPEGTSIPMMYPFWLLGLLILYPLCLWYGKVKGRQPPNSVLRFL
jgi:uncharacterized membrane protein